MALQEVSSETIDLYQTHLAVASEKLASRGILRLAVLGPQGSPSDRLARDLGVKDVDYHETYADVLAASSDPAIGSVMPYGTASGEAIMYDTEGKTKNLTAIIEVGRAMIADIPQPTDSDILQTKIVIKV